ncbi:hypothetical protein BDF21DRAFT_421818 [Thamnidium elegans]|uniref:Uncharacterized protein n=1 Tax=Thamnidium elegans TaxID=101142 RepID=A0A8H7SPM0_9FUNG|nr:hypothetical protein INT48_004797 [Thamnidium elegans]KAI8076999.1 hypothetical protein BDF21DRAFT_421818 [Thamnidium elegans]
MDCDYWAENCQIISAESIQIQLNNNLLNKLVALGHFFIQQKRSMLSIGQKHNPTIQLLYQISKDKFENECYAEEEKLVVIKDLCFKAKTQFEKIVRCLQNGGDSNGKVLQYAEDGLCFFQPSRTKIQQKSRSNTN